MNIKYIPILVALLLLCSACGLPEEVESEHSIPDAVSMEESAPAESSLSKSVPPESSGSDTDEPTDEEVDEEVAQATAELIRLCAALEYPGFATHNYAFHPIVQDAVGVELADFLSSATWRDVPEYSFTEPADAPTAFVVAGAVAMTGYLDHEQYREIYEHFWQVCPRYDYMKPREFVEQTARHFFGKDIVVEHQGVSFFSFCPVGQVYAFNGFGLMERFTPVVLAYQDTGDYYEVEVAYVTYAYGENEQGEYAPIIITPDGSSSVCVPGDDAPISQEAEDFLRSQPVHHVRLQKQPDGSLIYWSHRLPE